MVRGLVHEPIKSQHVILNSLKKSQFRIVINLKTSTVSICRMKLETFHKNAIVKLNSELGKVLKTSKRK